MVAPSGRALEQSDASHPGDEPAPPGCRTALTPQRLALAAIEIADSDGLAAVSMRRLAASLGVGTMTLYYHVRDKDELLGAMWDEFLAGHLLERIPEDWRAGLTEIAHRTRRSYQRHPWALRVGIRPGFGPNKLRYIEQALTVTSKITDDPEDQLRIIHSIGDLVVGCTLREMGGSDRVDQREVDWRNQALLTPDDLDNVLRSQPNFGAPVSAEELPHLSALSAIGCTIATPRFDRALGWMLDGIAAVYGLEPAAGPGSPGAALSALGPGDATLPRPAPNATDPKKGPDRPSRTRLK